MPDDPQQRLTPITDAGALAALMAGEVTASMAAHIERVVALSRTLAARYGADEAHTALMAQAHDLVRSWTDAALLVAAERRGLEVLAVERDAPVLLHGPIGALLLEERGWIADARVLNAVRYHTTGHPDYSTEAWAMFVADKVEPHKLERRPVLQTVVEAAARSPHAGALAYLELLSEDTRAAGRTEHPLAMATRDWLHRRV